MMFSQSLSDSIVPKNSNLFNKKVGNKKKTRQRKSKPRSDKIMLRDFKDVDPFHDALRFVKYYKSYILFCHHRSDESDKSIKPKFDLLESDLVFAGKILDLLIQKKKNKSFLKAWIRNYYKTKLKGAKASKIENTSLKTFGKTLDEFLRLSSMVE